MKRQGLRLPNLLPHRIPTVCIVSLPIISLPSKTTITIKIQQMKMRFAIAFFLLTVTTIAGAQSKVFKEVSADISSQMKPIMQEESLIGYLMFTQLEKSSKDSFNYKSDNYKKSTYKQWHDDTTFIHTGEVSFRTFVVRPESTIWIGVSKVRSSSDDKAPDYITGNDTQYWSK